MPLAARPDGFRSPTNNGTGLGELATRRGWARHAKPERGVGGGDGKVHASLLLQVLSLLLLQIEQMEISLPLLYCLLLSSQNVAPPATPDGKGVL
ncbi:unnamed protein product [Lampetra planeri]